MSASFAREMLRATAAGLAALGCALAHAGIQNVPCDRPYAFRGASVNVVVLPFSMPERSSATAERIAQLVQRETLRSIAKFSSVASVQLKQSPGSPCLAEEVRAKLLGERGGARAPVETGRGLVMVWGRIIESGDTLYSQVFVDFVRRGSLERLELPLADGRLAGTLSAQGFAGPQRRLERSLLQKIDELAQRNNVLFEQPDERSPKTTIPPELPFYYYVTEMRGDWMRVVAFTPDRPPGGQVQPAQNAFGGKQWMRAVAAEPEWTLRKVLPEMAFVEGVVGYLVLRDPNASRLPASRAAMLGASSRAFDEYQENLRRNSLEREQDVFDDRYVAARAVTLELQGMLRLPASDPPVADLRSAREKFVASSRLQPGNANARNLTLMVDLALAARTTEPAAPPVRTVDALLATLGIAPGHADLQANLRLAYRWLLGQAGARPAAWAPLSGDEQTRLAGTLAALNEVSGVR